MHFSKLTFALLNALMNVDNAHITQGLDWLQHKVYIFLKRTPTEVGGYCAPDSLWKQESPRNLNRRAQGIFW